MEFAESRDRDALAEFFRRRESTHVYGLADLDRPFWPDVRAFTALDGGVIVAVVLCLEALRVPLVYAVAPPDDEPTRELLRAVASEIATPCVATLSLGVASALGWDFDSAGEFLKMRLRSEVRPGDLAEHSSAHRLDTSDLDELRGFLEGRAYAEGEGGFFQPYMLELGPYYAIRDAGEIVAAGGVHVLSERHGVAGLGNIVTHPGFRGRGYAGVITRALCRELIPRIPVIALNVRRDNAPAVRCYTSVGFEPVLHYEEGWIRTSLAPATTTGRSSKTHVSPRTDGP